MATLDFVRTFAVAVMLQTIDGHHRRRGRLLLLLLLLLLLPLLLLLFIHQLLVLHLRQRMLQRMLPRLRHARHIFTWYCARRGRRGRRQFRGRHGRWRVRGRKQDAGL